MHAEPQKENQWLDRFIGQWTYESECNMGSDHPPSKTKGTEAVQSLHSSRRRFVARLNSGVSPASCSYGSCSNLNLSTRDLFQ
jgi:hypothetical protein